MKTASPFSISEFPNPSGKIVFQLYARLDGKRFRKNFPTRAEAEAERQVQEVQWLQRDTGARAAITRLNEDQLHEAEAVFRRVAGRPHLLSFYVEFALANYREPVTQKLLTEAVTEFLVLNRPAALPQGVLAQHQFIPDAHPLWLRHLEQLQSLHLFEPVGHSTRRGHRLGAAQRRIALEQLPHEFGVLGQFQGLFDRWRCMHLPRCRGTPGQCSVLFSETSAELARRVQCGEEQSMAVSDLASLLPDDHTVLLEFAVLDEEAFVFVARRTQEAKSGTPDVNLTVHRLEASPATLRSLAQEVQERCEMRSLAQRLGVVRRELYVALLEPATGDIAGAHTLVIIPDDFLWQVPFAALERGDGSCVLDHHALAYAPSAHAWRAMRRLRERHAVLLAGNSSPAAGLPTLLAVANPDLGATRPSAMPLLGGFDAIPGTERQGRAIAALFGERATALIGAEATEERTRAECGSHRLLHFATHGVFDSASPLHSGLLLTPGPNDDGYFTAREIMEHNLNADLVVLSACSTARGGMRAGEGILGLSWALFVAGAPSSVLTQWKVADESTADLMVEFYRRLQQYLTSGTAEGSLASKAECLRQAQLGLRKNVAWSHPFFWAPFVLVGDPE